MKSNMIIKAEILPGATISEAIEEAKQKAKLWKVAFIEFDFNGTDFYINSHTDVKGAISGYEDLVQKNMAKGKRSGE